MPASLNGGSRRYMDNLAKQIDPNSINQSDDRYVMFYESDIEDEESFGGILYNLGFKSDNPGDYTRFYKKLPTTGHFICAEYDIYNGDGFCLYFADEDEEKTLDKMWKR